MGNAVRLMGVGLALAMAGCVARSPSTAPHASPVVAATDFTVVAVPAYRLVTGPNALDAPSRLLAVRVQIESTGQSSYLFAPDDLTIALPDGTHARIYDRARADQLLRRTLLAEADMSYLMRPGHLPGGVGTYSAEALAAMVETNLLSDGVFGPGQPLQGYVVIDTAHPLMSLDGASFEVIARRQGDDIPTRYAYQLATAPYGATTGAQ
jgi:hypothetical protein